MSTNASHWTRQGVLVMLLMSLDGCATKGNKAEPKDPTRTPSLSDVPQPKATKSTRSGHKTDIHAYSVKLNLLPHSDWIRGIATIRFAPSSAVELSLEKLDVLSIKESKGRKLKLSKGLVALADHNASMTELRIVYRATFGGGLRKSDNFIYTAFDTMDWMPVHFSPDDRATFELTLNMPSGYTASAPGKKTKHRKLKGSVEVGYQLSRASPAYVLGFAAGPFQEHVAHLGNTEHRIFHQGFSADQLALLTAKANAAIEFFAEISGVAHPSPSFSQVWITDRIAQELVDMATMNDAQAAAMFENPQEDWMLVHEISHQWWGNSVTCSTWSDFWLNEAFATFMVAAFKQRVWGEAAYQREIELARNRLERLIKAKKDGPLKLKASAKASDAGGPIPYVKGILLLTELRSLMGEAAFWAGVRSYTREHWLGNATSWDFESAMQSEANVDLGEIFARWGAHSSSGHNKSTPPKASMTGQTSATNPAAGEKKSLPPNETKSTPETSKACPDGWTKTETLHGSIHLPAGFQAAVSSGDDSVGFRASGNLQGPVQLFFEEGPGVPQEPRQLPVPYPEELDQLPMRRVILRCGQSKQQAGILYYNDRLEGSKTYAEGIFFEGTTNVVERFRLTFPPSALDQVSDILSTVESP